MNRTTWTVAWRAARRRLGRTGRRIGEAAVLDEAERELGRRLTLTEQCAAGACRWARQFETEAAYFARLRTKRHYALADLCRDRWEREAREAAAAELVAAEVPYTPRDPRKFIGA